MSTLLTNHLVLLRFAPCLELRSAIFLLEVFAATAPPPLPPAPTPLSSRAAAVVVVVALASAVLTGAALVLVRAGTMSIPCTAALALAQRDLDTNAGVHPSPSSRALACIKVLKAKYLSRIQVPRPMPGLDTGTQAHHSKGSQRVHAMEALATNCSLALKCKATIRIRPGCEFSIGCPSAIPVEQNLKLIK